MESTKVIVILNPNGTVTTVSPDYLGKDLLKKTPVYDVHKEAQSLRVVDNTLISEYYFAEEALRKIHMKIESSPRPTLVAQLI